MHVKMNLLSENAGSLTVLKRKDLWFVFNPSSQFRHYRLNLFSISCKQ